MQNLSRKIVIKNQETLIENSLKQNANSVFCLEKVLEISSYIVCFPPYFSILDLNLPLLNLICIDFDEHILYDIGNQLLILIDCNHYTHISLHLFEIHSLDLPCTESEVGGFSLFSLR